jgi:tripartite-type tricarboxylate transporter receptor subunit TctC
LRKLDAAIKASVQKSETQTRLISAGGEEAYMGMDEFSRFIAADTQMWERINKMLRK